MKPAYEILADDVRITDLLRDRFISLTYTDESGFGSDTLEILLDNRDLKIQPPKTGVELSLSLGYVGTGVRKMGLLVVDEYERSGMPHKLLIRAKSAWGGDGKNKSETVKGITTALKTQRTRSWDSKTLGSILEQLAAECGLEPCIDLELSSEWIAHIDQTDEGNSNFMLRLAEERDAVFKPAGGKLIFMKRAKGQTVTGVDVPMVYLTLGSPQPSAAKPYWAKLLGSEDSYRLTVAERENFKSVTAYYHDVSAAERKAVTIGDGDPSRKLIGNYATPAEAAQAADAEMRRIGRGKSAPTFNCEGDPLLVSEGKVTADDTMGSDLEGEWLIRRAVHKIDDNGYTTALECEVPKRAGAPDEPDESAAGGTE